MADVSKLKLNGTLYNIKDTAARSTLSGLGTASTKDFATVNIGTSGEATGALPTVAQVKTYVAEQIQGAIAASY